MAWKTIRAAPPSTIRITIAISAPKKRRGRYNGWPNDAMNWPLFRDIVECRDSSLALRFCEWAVSPETTPQMADPFAIPKRVVLPQCYELCRTVHPCGRRLRNVLTTQIKQTRPTVRIEIL